MRTIHGVTLSVVSTISACLALPAYAQNAEPAASANDIIVTAQRVEQRLQDVPISITVFNQGQLNANNVTNARDLATYTPGLQINSRYGADATNFSIRGFTQEQRTSATVGTYFADVVAPRGSGATFGGDGAGPGSLFDLQNVQVLKGPQGTLFGRNSTGGAVLLVPRRPTDKLEGYVEGTIGDYKMRRGQAVINIPVNDTFKLRFGVDRMTRDGYLRNIGNLGDGADGNKGVGNVDYIAARASMVANLTPTLEDYVVATFSHSRSNGVIPHTYQCFPGVAARSAQGFLPFGDACAAQLAREAPYGPYTVEQRLPNSLSQNDQWQVINTVTWLASDSLTIKNITAYGEFRATTNLDLYGNYFPVSYNPAAPLGSRFALIPASSVTSGNQVTGFAFTSAEPYTNRTNAQSSFVEELQFQGHPGSGRFVWQAGLYMELNDPLGFSGVQTAVFAACGDIKALDCAFGSPNFQRSATKFRDYAAYAQASYDLTDKLKLTAGIRYTRDEQSSRIQIEALNIPGRTTSCVNTSVFGNSAAGRTFPIDQRIAVCNQTIKKNTSAPTWLIDLDYKPIPDVLLYAKYARGYRQGGLSIFSPDTTQGYDKESVDTYEAGVKANWRGSIPGSFNLSGFYNNFRDQQLLVGVTSSLGLAPSSASVINAGKSYLAGAEAELNVRPFEGLNIDVAYAYLKTKLQKFVVPPFPAGSLYDTVTAPLVGGPIPNSIPHKVNVTASYTLPLPEDIGRITIGGTYVYRSRYRAVAAACPFAGAAGCTVPLTGGAGTVSIVNPQGGVLPGANIVNINVTWENVGQLPIDVSGFITNLTKEVSYLSSNDNSSRGFISGILSEPRMFGVRVRYRFGD